MAQAANQPADDEDDDETAGSDSGADATGEGSEGDSDTDSSDAEDNVICTIMCIPGQPGQYKLVKGDEDDDSAGAGGEGSEDEEGTTYKSEGLLLKAILETIRDYESEKAGGGSAQDNMMAGYGEEPDEPTQQKYND